MAFIILKLDQDDSNRKVIRVNTAGIMLLEELDSPDVARYQVTMLNGREIVFYGAQGHGWAASGGWVLDNIVQDHERK